MKEKKGEKQYDPEKFTGTTYMTEEERKQTHFPYENYEEDAREAIRNMRKNPEICEFFKADPDEIEACIETGETLKPQETDLYNQWRLLRDKRLRCEAYAWGKLLDFRRDIQGMAENRPEIHQEFRVLFDKFVERGVKAAKTRKENKEKKKEEKTKEEKAE